MFLGLITSSCMIADRVNSITKAQPQTFLCSYLPRKDCQIDHCNICRLTMFSFPELRLETFIVVFCAAGAVFTIGALLYLRLFYVDIPKIDGIPEIPNGDLLAGHLYQLKEDHANTLHLWSLKYGWPVFQGRMGYRRAVFINSFDTAQEWITKNHAATADRPWFHTFHGVVSATSGLHTSRLKSRPMLKITLTSRLSQNSGDYWLKSME